MRQKMQSPGADVSLTASLWAARRSGAGPGTLQLGVEVLETSRRDTAGLDEPFDITLLETDDPAEFVGRDHALVDEPVEAAEGHAEMLSRLLGAHPMDLFVHRAPGIVRHYRSATVAICALSDVIPRL